MKSINTQLPIRILVANQRPDSADNMIADLCTQIDFQVVGQANTIDTLYRIAAASAPDVIICDLEMPGLDIGYALRLIREQNLAVGIIVVGTMDDVSSILDAIQAGAQGCLIQGALREDLYRAIRIVNQGGAVISPRIKSILHDRMRGDTDELQPLIGQFSAQEIEILARLAEGAGNREIARRIGIAENEVNANISKIMKKFEVQSPIGAVARAAQIGLIKS